MHMQLCTMSLCVCVHVYVHITYSHIGFIHIHNNILNHMLCNLTFKVLKLKSWNTQPGHWTKDKEKGTAGDVCRDAVHSPTQAAVRCLILR